MRITIASGIRASSKGSVERLLLCGYLCVTTTARDTRLLLTAGKDNDGASNGNTFQSDSDGGQQENLEVTDPPSSATASTDHDARGLHRVRRKRKGDSNVGTARARISGNPGIESPVARMENKDRERG